MPLEPVNLLLGTAFGILLREVVEERKGKRRRRARDAAITDAVQAELAEVRRLVTANVEMLRRGRHEAKHFPHFREQQAGPLYRPPTRLDDLLREKGAPDVVRNSQVIRLFSQIVAATARLNVLEEERLSYKALHESRFGAAPRSDDDGLRKRELDLLDRSADLLELVSLATAVVEVIQRARDEKIPRVLKIRSYRIWFKAPWSRICLPDAAHARCLAAIAQRSLAEPGAPVDPARGACDEETLEDLARCGLACEGSHRATQYGWRATPRGHVYAGGYFPFWVRPAESEPHEGYIDRSRFWARGRDGMWEDESALEPESWWI